MRKWKDEFVLNGIMICSEDRFSFNINSEELIIKYEYPGWTTSDLLVFLFFNIFFVILCPLIPVGIIFLFILGITMNIFLYYIIKRKAHEKEKIISTFDFMNCKIFMKKYELAIDFSEIEKLVYCKNYCGASENWHDQLLTLTYNKRTYLLAYTPSKEEFIPENVLTKLKGYFLVRELDYYTKTEVDI